MKSNLILTGWHYSDYLAAAAAVYGHYEGNADVRAVSMGELAAVLERCGADYRNIDILGIGLTEKLDRLTAAVKTLLRGGTAVNYYSARAFPEEAKTAFETAGTSFSVLQVQDGTTLLQVAADHFSGISASDLERLRAIGSRSDVSIENYARGSRKKGGRGEELTEADVWNLLFAAAGFAHRDHGDDGACGEVVKAVWKKTPVTPALPPYFRKLMDDYQAGYNIEYLGKSALAAETRLRLQKAACFDAHVLILGATGTGKQVAAEYIHTRSDRCGKPFKHYNCAYGGNEDMLMTRLFGYAPNSFTGASKEGATGLFDDANGGTLFLDEIAETSAKVQAMLLTVIETGRFVRVGGREKDAVTVNVRLICATNRDLQQMVLDDAFRLDLYERIAEFPVRLHRLCDRKEDIDPIVKHYWRNMTGKIPSKQQIEALMDYDYPGNVRELISLLKQAKSLGEEDFGRILAEHKEFNRTLIEGLRRKNGESTPNDGFPDSQKEMLCRHAVSVYRKYGRNCTQAAKAAGIAVNTMKSYLRLAGKFSLVP